MSKLLTVGFLSGAGYYVYDTVTSKAQEPPPPPNVVIPKAEITFEEPRPKPGTQTGDLLQEISPQHRQIKQSLEQPGVYAWGSNAGRVVAPDSGDPMIKRPRRIAALDGLLLRDLKLDRDLGVAVTEKGDVIQWGDGFWGKYAEATAPVVTFRGKDIVKVTLSQDRIIALSSGGTVYSLPASRADQHQRKPAEAPQTSSSWSSLFWGPGSSPAAPPTNYRVLTPTGLSWGERVVDISSGLEHCLLLTSKGRVLSAVSSFVSFPTRGQLGVPGLTWTTRPQGVPLDQPHAIPGLHGVAAAQIATGDYHSVVRSRDGQLFVFGDNAAGQLGLPVMPEASFVPEPVQLPVQALYEADKESGSAFAFFAAQKKPTVPPPQVTSIAAGGANSFFTVDAYELEEGADDKAKAKGKPKVREVADTWACGAGLYGNLGTGKWVHISASGPSKVKALSGLTEYSEAAGQKVPIRLVSMAVGATHASAVLGNATHVPSNITQNKYEPSWGSEVFWWGGNEFHQLGTGRRNNVCEPVRIEAFETADELAAAAAAAAAAAKKKKAAKMPELTGERERLELVPRTTVRVGKGGWGRRVSTEQRVVCGRYVSGVYFST